ncbi:hypothetical protein COUCH_17590 [Couchioplanes caeruleus]|uniref:hypothetical protein n=1 Tax=Couchioplanes caeruleus TaxID=56438 RepID=UPI0020BE0B49|nr:hypothetical protein [Couchioplanes caeruleus]UQU67979.1 hypothetical protein COUCH_17590 [Couchioplanes caeruleus]
MEILSFDGPAARPMEAFGSVGVTAQVLVKRGAAVVTVLRVAAAATSAGTAHRSTSSWW